MSFNYSAQDSYKYPTADSKASEGVSLLGDAAKQKAADLAHKFDNMTVSDDRSWEGKSLESKHSVPLAKHEASTGLADADFSKTTTWETTEGRDNTQLALESGIRAGQKVEDKTYQAQAKVEDWQQAAIQKKDDLKEGARQTVDQAQAKVSDWQQLGAEKIDNAKAIGAEKIDNAKAIGAEKLDNAAQQTKETAWSLERSGEASRLSTQDSLAASASNTASRLSEKLDNLRPDETSTQNKSLPVRAADMAIGAASAVAGAAKAMANTVVGAIAPNSTSTTTTVSDNDMQVRSNIATQDKLDDAGNKIDSLSYKASAKVEDAKAVASENLGVAKGYANQVGQAIVNAATSLEHRLEIRGQCARAGGQERLADAGEQVAREQGDSKLTDKAQEMRPADECLADKSTPLRAVDTVIGAGAMVVDAAKAVGGAVMGAVENMRHPQGVEVASSSSTTTFIAPNAEIDTSSISHSSAPASSSLGDSSNKHIDASWNSSALPAQPLQTTVIETEKSYRDI